MSLKLFFRPFHSSTPIEFSGIFYSNSVTSIVCVVNVEVSVAKLVTVAVAVLTSVTVAVAEIVLGT
jgi:hypothetical protein